MYFIFRIVQFIVFESKRLLLTLANFSTICIFFFFFISQFFFPFFFGFIQFLNLLKISRLRFVSPAFTYSNLNAFSLSITFRTLVHFSLFTLFAVVFDDDDDDDDWPSIENPAPGPPQLWARCGRVITNYSSN